MATPNPSVVPEAPAHVPADAAPADDGTGPAQAQTSSNPAPGGGGSTAVTAERKRALLLEARADRLAWVDGVASPFRPSGAGAGSGGTAADLLARLLGSTRAGRGSLGSAFGIAAALYGAPLSGEGGTEEGGWSGGLSRSEALERMRRQLESSLSTDEAKRLLEAAAADEDGAGGGASADPAYVAAYRTFLNRLREPEAADLVQGMKHFALAFRTQAGALVERSAGGREARPRPWRYRRSRSRRRQRLRRRPRRCSNRCPSSRLDKRRHRLRRRGERGRGWTARGLPRRGRQRASLDHPQVYRQAGRDRSIASSV